MATYKIIVNRSIISISTSSEAQAKWKCNKIYGFYPNYVELIKEIVIPKDAIRNEYVMSIKVLNT